MTDLILNSLLSNLGNKKDVSRVRVRPLPCQGSTLTKTELSEHLGGQTPYSRKAPDFSMRGPSRFKAFLKSYKLKLKHDKVHTRSVGASFLGSSNGRTFGFGPKDGGSTPSPRTRIFICFRGLAGSLGFPNVCNVVLASTDARSLHKKRPVETAVGHDAHSFQGDYLNLTKTRGVGNESSAREVTTKK